MRAARPYLRTRRAQWNNGEADRAGIDNYAQKATALSRLSVYGPSETASDESVLHFNQPGRALKRNALPPLPGHGSGL